MNSLRFLNGIYHATLGLCGLIGLVTTDLLTQFTAGLALFAVWMTRTIIDGLCEPA